jgi:hypothetical protein
MLSVDAGSNGASQKKLTDAQSHPFTMLKAGRDNLKLHMLLTQ